MSKIPYSKGVGEYSHQEPSDHVSPDAVAAGVVHGLEKLREEMHSYVGSVLADIDAKIDQEIQKVDQGIQDVGKEIQKIEVSTTGINLLRGTRDFSLGQSKWSRSQYFSDGFYTISEGISYKKDDDGFTVATFKANGDYKIIISSVIEESLRVGDVLTISFDCKFDFDDHLENETIVRTGFVSSINNSLAFGAAFNISDAIGDISSIESGKWYKAVIKHSVIYNTSSAQPFIMGFPHQSGNQAMSIKKVSINDGAVDNPIWSISPFDVPDVDRITDSNIDRVVDDPVGDDLYVFGPKEEKSLLSLLGLQHLWTKLKARFESLTSSVNGKVSKSGDTMSGNLSIYGQEETASGADNGYTGKIRAGVINVGDRCRMFSGAGGGYLDIYSPSGNIFRQYAADGTYRLAYRVPSTNTETTAIWVNKDVQMTLAKPLPIGSGGTGASSVSAARTNLGIIGYIALETVTQSYTVNASTYAGVDIAAPTKSGYEVFGIATFSSGGGHISVCACYMLNATTARMTVRNNLSSSQTSTASIRFMYRRTS